MEGLRLRFATMAEAFRPHDGGLPDILGAWDYWRFPAFPGASDWQLVMSWEATPTPYSESGKVIVLVYGPGPDGAEIRLARMEVLIIMTPSDRPADWPNTATVALPIRLNFPAPGPVRIEFWQSEDGPMYGEVRLRVVEG